MTTRESDVRCPRCGAPLLLGPEPSAADLDRTIDLDRRLGRSAQAEPRPPLLHVGMEPPARPAAPARAPPASTSGWAEAGIDPAEKTPTSPAARPPPLPRKEIASELDVQEVQFRRASSWRRAIAWAIDLVCLGLFAVLLFRVGLAIAGLSPAEGSRVSGLDWFTDALVRYWSILGPLIIFTATAAFVYGTLTHALMGATVGKRLIGLRVVTTRGDVPTIARSAVRSGLALLSFAALGLGFLAALFTRSHRAAHDIVARTYVVETS